jgi:hypothetical protein
MAKRRRKQKGINPKAYTLETAIVRDYIVFYTVREMGLVKKVMPEDCRTEVAFCIKHGLSAKSSNTLHNYVNIKGFYDAVEVEKKKHQHLLSSIGMGGITKRGEGMFLRKQVLDAAGNIHVLLEEIPPDVKACERLIQLGGGDIVDNINVTGTDAISAAAKRITDTEDLK